MMFSGIFCFCLYYTLAVATLSVIHKTPEFGRNCNKLGFNRIFLTRDERCHFLRVDKEDFNRILRDVEAKTERLKENGKDVLVLEKLSRSDGSQR